MAYSIEYKTWTGENVDGVFSLENADLLPGESDDMGCEGIGSLGRHKTDIGTLMLKMKSFDENGFEMIPFLEIRTRYTLTPYLPGEFMDYPGKI